METDVSTDTTDGASSQQSTPDEMLGPYDIICGRNKLAFNNIGNRRFRVTIQLCMDRYMAATTRNDTSTVIKYVASMIQENGGRFLRLSPDGKSWIELDSKQIHEKVGHALRDAAPSKRESFSATTTNDNHSFPYTRPSRHAACLRVQQDSTNLLNIPTNGLTVYRREIASSLLPHRFLLQEQGLDQSMTTSHSQTVNETGSKLEGATLLSKRSQDNDSKPPAQQPPPAPVASQNVAILTSTKSPSSQDLSPKTTESCSPDAYGTCSIDRDQETFDHSSLGDHHDNVAMDWQSDETEEEEK
jgi:hypothetical protein